MQVFPKPGPATKSRSEAGGTPLPCGNFCAWHQQDGDRGACQTSSLVRMALHLILHTAIHLFRQSIITRWHNLQIRVQGPAMHRKMQLGLARIPLLRHDSLPPAAKTSQYVPRENIELAN